MASSPRPWSQPTSAQRPPRHTALPHLTWLLRIIPLHGHDAPSYPLACRQIAAHAPSSVEALFAVDISGVSETMKRTYGAHIVAAVAQARAFARGAGEVDAFELDEADAFKASGGCFSWVHAGFMYC